MIKYTMTHTFNYALNYIHPYALLIFLRALAIYIYRTKKILDNYFLGKIIYTVMDSLVYLKVINIRKIICKNCGVVNEISAESLGDDNEWLDCLLPEGFEWILPAGKITPVIGDPIYISGLGEHLSCAAYLDKYSIDPEIAYQLIRGNSRARSAVLNNVGRQRVEATTAAAASSKGRSQGWLDSDDWTS